MKAKQAHQQGANRELKDENTPMMTKSEQFTSYLIHRCDTKFKHWMLQDWNECQNNKN